MKKRVTVFKNGSLDNGKAILVEESFEKFLLNVCDVFGNPSYKRIFTQAGGEINDSELIRDDEVLFASEGEPFIRFFEPKCTDGNIGVQDCPEWIKLNVGGHLFYTSRITLLNREPNSMLARMFDPDSNIKPSCVDPSGAYLIDREPKYFGPILNYLRSGILILDNDVNPKVSTPPELPWLLSHFSGVLEEANFFGVQSCIPALEGMVIPKDEIPLTRRDVINAIITTPNKYNLRFQGVNLNGADLSYLDLRNINFKYAKLRNAKLSYSNLSYCNFERADLSGVEMNYAILSGVRMVCAVLENSSCANCNFQDPTGYNANMEGVNFRNAILEDSDLTGANLRVANLKHANLKATILRGAVLAGADLEMCDLTGSDLHEANLRGANLKDAALELMINPLHMAQTIR